MWLCPGEPSLRLYQQAARFVRPKFPPTSAMGMPSKPPSATGSRQQHRRLSSAQRGYGAAWQRARAAYLAEPGNQFCRMCQAIGRLNPGTLRMDGSLELNPRRIGLVVNHKIPHRGDQQLFWDRANWEPLCHDHHDIVQQRLEHGGSEKGAVGMDGRPIGSHPWNRRAQ